MLYLNATDIRMLFSMTEAIESDKEAFTLETHKETQIPVRINFDVNGKGISSFMPGYLPTYPQVGIKIVSTYPDNAAKGIPAVGATVVLLDPETGYVNAILDGTELTRLRTGAVSGCATEILANKTTEKFALFGTGGQAYSQLEAVLTVRNVKYVYVYDKLEERIPVFVENTKPLAEKFGVVIMPAQSPDDAVDDGAELVDDEAGNQQHHHGDSAPEQYLYGVIGLAGLVFGLIVHISTSCGELQRFSGTISIQ